MLDLLAEARPISRLERFGDAGEHLWSVSGLRRIDQMTIPRSPRYSIAVEERALRLHQAAREDISVSAVERRRGELPIDAALKGAGDDGEMVRSRAQRCQRLAVAGPRAGRDLVDEFADPRGVRSVLERHDVGVRESKGHEPPQPRHRRVIAKAGIAELRHPQVVVV